jgi:hypothetical protein
MICMWFDLFVTQEDMMDYQSNITNLLWEGLETDLMPFKGVNNDFLQSLQSGKRDRSLGSTSMEKIAP